MNKRNYGDLSKIDKKMILLAGDSFFINSVEIPPLTLKEIKNLTYSRYSYYLNLICADLEKILNVENMDEKLVQEIKENKFTILDMIIVSGDKNFEKEFRKAVSVLLKESKIELDKKNLGLIIEENSFLSREDFMIFQDIVKIQNLLKNPEEKEYKPAGKKAAELVAKKKEIEKKLREKSKDKGLDLGDTIDIVSSYSEAVNCITVWDLTVFQLYNLFARMLLRDKYEKEFLVAMNTTDEGRKKLELKHWADEMQLIDDNN